MVERRRAPGGQRREVLRCPVGIFCLFFRDFEVGEPLLNSCRGCARAAQCKPNGFDPVI
jgi:hypothetical protein